MSAAEKPGNLLTAFTSNIVRTTGRCEQHGEAEVMVRSGMTWHCPECMVLRLQAEYAQQWAVERGASLHKIADVPLRYRAQKFAAVTPDQKRARATAAAFRDFIIAEQRWAALILVGSVGTGKTLLACEFAESYINRLTRSVRYVTGKGLISEIQASYGREGKSEEGELDRFAQYDLLILDEIDAIPTKDNAALLLNEVIDRRYRNNKPMIVITNQPFNDLARYIGDRVYDRLHENAFVCDFCWPSFRRQT